MMKLNISSILSTIVLFVMVSIPTSLLAKSDNNQATTKQERNYITQGNALYNQRRFAEAEVMYKKALEIAPGSEIANYNLASALIRQSGSTNANEDKNPLSEAQKILTGLAQNGKDKNVVEKAYYNLGNMAYNSENYQQAIDMYKNALRRNPDNDKARQNLRLAQLKKQEQQDNQNKQDQQNQQNEDQKQDQNKNQDQQNQQQQQDKQQQQQDQSQGSKNDDKQQQQPQQQRGGISDANAEKILKAMENEEAATRRRIEAQKQKSEGSSQRMTNKPW